MNNEHHDTVGKKVPEITEYMRAAADIIQGNQASIPGATTIAKTRRLERSNRAAELRLFADAIDAAYERETGKLMDTSEHWAKTCLKCADGEIEPDCMYHGDPDGCNSPIRGHHPVTPYGDPARLRKALENLMPLARCYIRKTPARTIYTTDENGVGREVNIREAYAEAEKALEEGRTGMECNVADHLEAATRKRFPDLDPASIALIYNDDMSPAERAACEAYPEVISQDGTMLIGLAEALKMISLNDAIPLAAADRYLILRGAFHLAKVAGWKPELKREEVANG